MTAEAGVAVVHATASVTIVPTPASALVVLNKEDHKVEDIGKEAIM